MGDWGPPGLSVSPQAQQETQKAALRYERAVSMHNAAREMVFVAEQGVMADKNRLDPTWQEMLNHATCKVRVLSAGAPHCPLASPLPYLHFLPVPPQLWPSRSFGYLQGGTCPTAAQPSLQRFHYYISLLEILLSTPVSSGWGTLSSSQAVALDSVLTCLAL